MTTNAWSKPWICRYNHEVPGRLDDCPRCLRNETSDPTWDAEQQHVENPVIENPKPKRPDRVGQGEWSSQGMSRDTDDFRREHYGFANSQERRAWKKKEKDSYDAW